MAKELRYYVEYKVAGFDGVQRSGPFDTYAAALVDSKDIEGYTGIYDCNVVSREVDK